MADRRVTMQPLLPDATYRAMRREAGRRQLSVSAVAAEVLIACYPRRVLVEGDSQPMVMRGVLPGECQAVMRAHGADV